MKKTRYSDEQIVRILREADKDSVAEVAKRHGVSEATIYVWRKKFGSMETDEVGVCQRRCPVNHAARLMVSGDS